RSALFALRTFTSELHDRTLRVQLLQFLVAKNAEPQETLSALILTAKGIGALDVIEWNLAALAIQKISERERFPVRKKVFPKDKFEVHELLKHSSIRNIKPLGGGVNTTLIVEFTNGSKAVWKSRLGENGY